MHEMGHYVLKWIEFNSYCCNFVLLPKNTFHLTGIGAKGFNNATLESLSDLIMHNE